MLVQFEASQKAKIGDNIARRFRRMLRSVTPGQLFRRLPASSDTDCKIAAVDNSNTSEAILLLLADDENVDVRYAMAENHNISQKVLNKLCLDSNPYVVKRAQTTMARIDFPACLAEDSCIVTDEIEFPVNKRAGDELHSEAELECKRLLTVHERSGKKCDMTVVSLLHNLAQALEGQSKFAEGYKARIRARDLLMTLMLAS